jgi:tRNA threonylcarbamoyladenosine modification (KEOPS) complex  Pcc1 subunit
MLVSGTIEVLLNSKEAAESACSALGSESGSLRASITKKVDGRKLLVSIEAKDAVAYRALVNGIMRNLQVIEEIEDNEVFQ